MTKVWFMQDCNDMRVAEVFTTKKAVIEKVKQTYGRGRFHYIRKDIGQYFRLLDDKHKPVCYIEQVPVRKIKR